VDHHASSYVVAGDQAVYRRRLTDSVPRHLRKVGVVIACVVLERRQELHVQRVPEPKLHRWLAVWARGEVLRDGLPVRALGCCRESQELRRLYRGGKAMEAIGRDAVALVYHHRVPVVLAELLYNASRRDAVYGREQVIVLQ